MKFLIFFLLLITERTCSQDLLWVQFVAENKRCSVDPNYLKISDFPIVRVEQYSEKYKIGSVTDYYWIQQKYQYRFEFEGLELFFVKRYFQTDEVIWKIHVDLIKFAITK